MESLVLPLKWDPGVLSCTLYQWHCVFDIVSVIFNTKRKKIPGLCEMKFEGLGCPRPRGVEEGEALSLPSRKVVVRMSCASPDDLYNLPTPFPNEKAGLGG